MFYFLSNFHDIFSFFNIFRYITFRAGAAAFTSFFLCLILAPIFIRRFQKEEIKEGIDRDYCEALSKIQGYKQGTPTMGGIFVVASILVSMILWADLTNHYVLLTMLTCLGLSVLGFTDDYLKIRQKGHQGLRGWTKLFWQFILGATIGYYVVFHSSISTRLDVPFAKSMIFYLGFFYIPWAALIVMSCSNAVNLTDGLDGLAIGCVLFVAIGLGVLSYISGNFKFAEYLLLPYIAGTGELTIACAAIVGASLGFLWFNCYPASIFMGDVGSLALGGTLGVIAIFIKKELLLVLLGGIFVWEALSVILQVASFKIRHKRIFKMSPFHHHLQLLGWNESKIIVRFWIIAIILALLTLTTIKIR
ncbi:MAG: phospho-N-acetylmuramoyl-pentapeptide-transferase [Candidatus Omnitrophica bacterium]|nr:phospho-N-acetylmuramoyl-pentapeptide-transferase [Candidatus Omnitrophota bacterium]